jgi:hypothetical protein
MCNLQTALACRPFLRARHNADDRSGRCACRGRAKEPLGSPLARVLAGPYATAPKPEQGHQAGTQWSVRRFSARGKPACCERRTPLPRAWPRTWSGLRSDESTG